MPIPGKYRWVPEAVPQGSPYNVAQLYAKLAERIQGYIRDKMPEWKTQYEGVENMTLAVMGCVVNGPGESKAANIGISKTNRGCHAQRLVARGARRRMPMRLMRC